LLHPFTWKHLPISFASMLYGPISVTRRVMVVCLPYCSRQYIFFALVSLILPCLAGLLPFASPSDLKEHTVQYVKSRFTGSDVEDDY
jgi:hypothetical protein